MLNKSALIVPFLLAGCLGANPPTSAVKESTTLTSTLSATVTPLAAQKLFDLGFSQYSQISKTNMGYIFNENDRVRSSFDQGQSWNDGLSYLHSTWQGELVKKERLKEDSVTYALTKAGVFVSKDDEKTFQKFETQLSDFVAYDVDEFPDDGIVLRSNKGLLLTYDAGRNMYNIGENISKDVGVFDAETFESQLFVVTYDGSFYKSDDLGSSFKPVLDSEGKALPAIALAAVNSQLFMLGKNGIYQSSDKGLTFQNLKAFKCDGGYIVESNDAVFFECNWKHFTLDPATGEVKEWLGSATLPSGFGDGNNFLSLDTRALIQWTRYGIAVSEDLSKSFVTTKFILPSGGDDLIQFVEAEGELIKVLTHQSLYVSKDKGRTFERTALQPQNMGNSFDLAAEGDISVVASSTGLFLSTDSGQTYSGILDSQGMGYDAEIVISNGNLFLVNGRGAFVSKDFGKTFSKSLVPITFESSSSRQLWANGINVIVQSGDKYFLSRDSGRTYKIIDGLSGYLSNIVVLEDKAFIAASRRIMSLDLSTMELSTIETSFDIARMTVSASNIYLCGNGLFYQSADAGISFKSYRLTGDLTYCGDVKLLDEKLVVSSGNISASLDLSPEL